MNSRELIRHTQSLLRECENIRLGTNRDFGKKGRDSSVKDIFAIAMEEEDILNNYLKNHKIVGKNESCFIRETFLGCIRREHFLEETLQLFLQKAPGIFLKKNYYLYAIICYLGVWRIEEIGFTAYSRFVQCFDPAKMADLISFLFNPENLHGSLKKLWCTIFDEHFVRDTLIEPILQHVLNAKQLEKDLRKLAKNGMELQKTKKSTKPDPFLLTVPKPRRLPQPNFVISTVVKARPIPNSLFYSLKDQAAIDEKREENKEKSKKLYQEAQEKQFRVAKKPEVDKKALIREQVQKEESAKPIKKEIRYKTNSAPSAAIDVKSTTAAILREEALLRKKRKEQQAMIAAAEMGLQDVEEFEAWKDRVKIKEEEERLIDLGRKRLEVQLLREDTYLARKELIKENKEKVAVVRAEKEEIKQFSEEIKKEIEQENLKKIEDVRLIKENAQKAKEILTKEKVKNASQILHEKKQLLKQIKIQQEKEKQRKTQLIQQIRILELAQSKSPVKEVDFTESSGLGLLGEMSVAELHERLAIVKAKEAEAEELKRQKIASLKNKKDQELLRKIQSIDQERQERRQKRISKSLPDQGVSAASFPSERGVWEKDERLKSLQAKILQKKALRKNDKAVPKTKLDLGRSSSQPFGSSLVYNDDEVELAQREYKMEKAGNYV